MKINTSLALRKPLVLEEVIDFSKADLTANYSLKAIQDVHVKATVTLRDELFEVELHILAKLELECGYTLEIFPETYEIDDVLYFSLSSGYEDDEEVFYERGPVIELDDYIFGLIIAYIPLRVVKPGATLPPSDGTFDVTDEEAFNAKRDTTNSAFSELNPEDFPD